MAVVAVSLSNIAMSQFLKDLMEEYYCSVIVAVETDSAVGFGHGQTHRQHQQRQREQNRQRWGELSSSNNSSRSSLQPRLPRSSSDEELFLLRKEERAAEEQDDSTATATNSDMPRRSRLSPTASFDAYDPLSQSRRRRRTKGERASSKRASTTNTPSGSQNFVWTTTLPSSLPTHQQQLPTTTRSTKNNAMTVAADKNGITKSHLKSTSSATTTTTLIASLSIAATSLEEEPVLYKDTPGAVLPHPTVAIDDVATDDSTIICSTSPTSPSQFASVFDEEHTSAMGMNGKQQPATIRDSLTLPMRRPFRKMSMTMDEEELAAGV